MDSHHHKYDKLSLFIILFSILVFTLETVPSLAPYHHVFHGLEIFFVVVFTLEYLYRLKHSKQKWGFVFSFYGLIDLISILPFYVSLGFADLRWVRIFRVVRVFRIFKLGRYIKAVDRLKLAINNVREELIVFSLISFILIYLSAVGVYYFERDAQPEHFKSIIHALWFSAVTLTTVGYGDIYPVTGGGKVFTGIILLLGLGLISIPSGLLASSFTRVFKHEDQKKQETISE